MNGPTLLATGRLYHSQLIVHTAEGVEIGPFRFLDDAEARAFLDALFAMSDAMQSVSEVVVALCDEFTPVEG